MEKCLRGCNELQESVYWAIPQKGEAEAVLYYIRVNTLPCFAPW